MLQSDGYQECRLRGSKCLVPIHGHALALPAKLAIGRWRDRSAAAVHLCRALLECKQLLGTERLVVDLRCGLDQVLKMGAGEEVAEVDEFAVLLVLDVDGSPAVLATTDSLAINVDVALAADNCERNDRLIEVSRCLYKSPEDSLP